MSLRSLGKFVIVPTTVPARRISRTEGRLALVVFRRTSIGMGSIHLNTPWVKLSDCRRGQIVRAKSRHCPAVRPCRDGRHRLEKGAVAEAIARDWPQSGCVPQIRAGVTEFTIDVLYYLRPFHYLPWNC
jgi:hypothetical protein